MNSRYLAVFLALCSVGMASPVQAAKWVRNPSQPSQWIDLDSRKHDDEVVRFTVSLGVDSDTGQPSTSDDDLVIELLNCESGKRVMMLPMLDNATRHLPTLSKSDPLFQVVCGEP